MIPRSSPKLPPYLWHHRVHTEKAGESLYFWRVGFGEVYERDKVKAAIRTACNRYDVGGLVAYELLGVYDLLLRIWLPQGCSFDAMHAALTEELTPAGLAILDPFRVSYMIRHWPFYEKGEQWAPTDAALHNLSPETIERVERSFAELGAEEVAELNGRHLLAPGNSNGAGAAGVPTAADEEEPEPEEGEEESLGIKFMMSVSAKEGLGLREMQRLEERITEILDSAEQVSQRSLYAGSGFGHFLILGRAGYGADSFHALQSELISQLNAAELREAYGTRTFSHLGGQRGYSMVSERLSGIDEHGLRPSPAIPVQEGKMERLAPGTRFADRFEIKEHLGEGGFAEVYRAYDRFERVDRALKLFRSNDPKMAMREISALLKVDHPNVAKLKFGEPHGSQWFIVFEFIDGQPLAEIDDISHEQAAAIAIEVLVALEAVHPDDERIAELERVSAAGEVSLETYNELEKLRSEGLVHRDIKPENIMIGKDGRVVLVDFNIASPARDKSETHSGTPEFFAPDAGLDYWDPADDLFACGVVLYKLMTGEHPFPNAHPIAGIDPIDPRNFAPTLPASLAELLVKACQPLRQDRYRTAREMRRALEEELLALKADSDAARAMVEFRTSRTRLGISVHEVAEASGLDAKRLSRLESGQTEANPGELVKLSVAIMRSANISKLFEQFPERNGENSHEDVSGPAGGGGDLLVDEERQWRRGGEKRPEERQHDDPRAPED
jgi:serine/threonine protein kinase